MKTVSDALVVCPSDVLCGLIRFALGHYGGVAIRAVPDFDSASATIVVHAPSIAIIDAGMPDAASVAHLNPPGTRVVAVNAGSRRPTWANAVVSAPFHPSELYDALETALA